MLIDTHILLWLATGRGPCNLGWLEEYRNSLAVSTVSLFEIIQKQRIGKLEKFDPFEMVADMGVKVLSLDQSIVAAYSRLPDLGWRDPFDHLLIATSVDKGLAFVTADENILSCRVPQLVTKAARQ